MEKRIYTHQNAADAIEPTTDIFSSLLVLFGLNTQAGPWMKTTLMAMAALND